MLNSEGAICLPKQNMNNIALVLPDLRHLKNTNFLQKPISTFDSRQAHWWALLRFSLNISSCSLLSPPPRCRKVSPWWWFPCSQIGQLCNRSADGNELHLCLRSSCSDLVSVNEDIRILYASLACRRHFWQFSCLWKKSFICWAPLSLSSILSIGNTHTPFLILFLQRLNLQFG